MARTFSRSVVLPATMRSEVWRTMPSNGTLAVEARYSARSWPASGLAAPGRERSTARSRLETLLVTSSTGALSPLQAASTNLAPEALSVTRAMWLALPVKVVSWALNQPSKSWEGTGTNTRAPPLASAIWTRVVISKVRAAPGWGANTTGWAKARPASGPATAASPRDFRSVRRRSDMIFSTATGRGGLGQGGVVRSLPRVKAGADKPRCGRATPALHARQNSGCIRRRGRPRWRATLP